MRIIDMPTRTRTTHRNRINRRIQQLRRSGWKWVKHGPTEEFQMCAIVDARLGQTGFRHNQLPDDTMYALNEWLGDYSDGRWFNIVDFNDSPNGAKSVDDVIVVLEKFAAEL